MFSPLQGLRILDLSRLIPGAAVTHRFADLGADVIKIEEPPVGDYIREVFPHADGISLQHLTLDRNKRSLALPLGTPEGVAILHHMVRSADAVVENSRPGTMRRRQADYETLAQINPRLVYLSFTGYGQKSRYAHLPSHGSNLAAFAAVNPIRRREDGVIVHGPTPYGRYRVPMEQAALEAAFMLLAALRDSQATGRGRQLDIAIVHALMAGDYAAMTDKLNNGTLHWQDLPQPTPKYAYYEARDGGVLLVCAIERRFWIALCEILERPDLADRGDWGSRQMDFGGGEDVALYEEVQRTFAQRDRADWLDVLIAEGIPCSPVNEIDDACADPDLGGRLFVDEVELPTGRTIRLMAPLVQDPPGSFVSRPAPSLGRDSAEVLTDFGVPAELVSALGGAPQASRG